MRPSLSCRSAEAGRLERLQEELDRLAKSLAQAESRCKLLAEALTAKEARYGRLAPSG